MKKFVALLLALGFVVPMFSGCSDKCAKDDAQCIADCIVDECGAAEDTSISDGFGYLQCVVDAEDTCVE